MGNLIIIDRKSKRANADENWQDPLGIDHAKREKARTISIPNEDRRPIYNFLREHSVKELLNKRVFCMKDNKEVMSGIVQDIIPPDYVVLRNKGVAKLTDVISIGD